MWLDSVRIRLEFPEPAKPNKHSVRSKTRDMAPLILQQAAVSVSENSRLTFVVSACRRLVLENLQIRLGIDI